MTKEEAIKILQNIVKHNEDEDAAIFMAIRALRDTSFLPSNLDEAAIQAAQIDMQDRQIMEATNDERLRYSRIFRRGFKSGAKWLAGQGETRDDIIVTGDFDNKAHIFPIPSSEFNPGDRVVIQIRKKQQ